MATPPPAEDPAEKAAAAFEARHEALTENFIACAINRAKLEAALKMAKKREKDALEDLSDHIDKGPQVMPLFDRPAGIVPPGCTSTVTPGGIAAHDPSATGFSENASASMPPATSAPVDPDAWKAASIDELQLKPALTERLKEAGLDTIGKLEAFRAEAADHREKWPKGVGTAKITEIENAVVDWLTKHRDAHLFPSAPSVTDATVPSYPTEAEWTEMTEEAQTSWLNERSVHLDSDDLDALANRVAEGCDDFFTDGGEAFNQGDEILHCPHSPGIECDAWILGWLWQGKQDEEGGEE